MSTTTPDRCAKCGTPLSRGNRQQTLELADRVHGAAVPDFQKVLGKRTFLRNLRSEKVRPMVFIVCDT